jgi:hypothetical protein
VSSVEELYDRIIDLAIKVSEGAIDPFDVDVGRFIRQLARNKRLAELDYTYLIKDIRALNGLVAILEAQGKSLRRRGLGLYLDKMLLKLRIYKMSIDELSQVFIRSWKPVIEMESINLEAIKEAMFYFNNLKDLESRRLRFEELSEYMGDVEPRLFIEPKVVRSLMMKLLNELRDSSGGEYIDYKEFITRGDPVERAYILSFLISDGWVDVKVDRLEEKIWIRPKDMRVEIRNPSSLAVVVRREEG